MSAPGTVLEGHGARDGHDASSAARGGVVGHRRLTSLYNSRYLNQVLRRESKRASRSGRPLSLLFLDLDGFKGVNDRHGHLCGSRALVEAAAVIRGCARETDVAARFGGDEFALVLPDTGSEGAVAVAERVATHRPYSFLRRATASIFSYASIAWRRCPMLTGADRGTGQSCRDTAMYRVKERGKTVSSLRSPHCLMNLNLCADLL